MRNFGFNIIDEIKSEVRERMRQVGEAAVEYAAEHGSYHDVTGRLRASNRYEVTDNGLELYNEMDYAAEVETRAEVLSGAALFAESELNDN